MKFGTARRTFEFTVEKSETYTIQRPAKIIAHWCDRCNSEAEMSKPEDAARITGFNTRQIYSEIENGKTHFTELADGSLMLCLRSIRNNHSEPPDREGELDPQ